jgi:hypothetical protein
LSRGEEKRAAQAAFTTAAVAIEVGTGGVTAMLNTPASKASVTVTAALKEARREVVEVVVMVGSCGVAVVLR